MCPLPIDWLDLLDGRPSAASRSHLNDCAACRTVVASLEAARGAGPLRVPMPDSRQPRPALASSDDSNITFGDLRWLEPPDGEVWLPVLVLGIVEEADGAIDVAPLSLDRDAATSVDLLLDAADTTTAVPWRVAFRRRSLVPCVRQGAVGHAHRRWTTSGQQGPRRCRTRRTDRSGTRVRPRSSATGG